MQPRSEPAPRLVMVPFDARESISLRSPRNSLAMSRYPQARWHQWEPVGRIRRRSHQTSHRRDCHDDRFPVSGLWNDGGRSAAVADLRSFQARGDVCLAALGLVHIYYLIGFRNRLVVFVNWCFTYVRGSRLITRDEESRSARKSQRLAPGAVAKCVHFVTRNIASEHETALSRPRA